MSEKVIVTAAITGAIHTPFMSDYLPITPQEIIEEVVRVYDAGAAVAHIHVRNPETGQPSNDMELYREVITEVKKRCPIILCLTTGGALGLPTAERVKVVPTFKPELASFNAGSINFALFHILDNKKRPSKFAWEDEYLAMTEDLIFANTFKGMKEYSQFFNDNEVKAEFEVYDIGMINNIKTLVDRGHIKQPVYLQFVMGILGGIPATIENLMMMVQTAKKTFGNDFTWSVCGAGRHQFPMCTQGLLLGGNVRVGLEDNLYVEKGKLAKSSAEQVHKIIRIAREIGREPANVEEARQILGLKGLAKVGY